MSENKLILTQVNEKILQITLNRPEIHNALNDQVMQQILEVLRRHREDPEVRAVTFTGAGDSFCAGADLQWMRNALNLSYEETVENSDLLAELFYTIFEYPKPTIALVNGAAVGGGVGFVATCDVVITATQAFYRLSEVRLGLIPAVISPFLLAKLGEGRCRELMLTGRKLSAEESLSVGLSNRLCPREEMTEVANDYCNYFRGAGPQALKWCKEIIASSATQSPQAVREHTVEIIAKLRTGAEGQEGMSAFLEKRTPAWRDDS